MPLHLALPDLLLPDDAPAPMRALRLARVERWLARGHLERRAARGLHAWLAQAFGIAGDPPVAAVTRAADDAPRPGSWLRADPVHLQAGQDAVTLRDADVLGVDRAEADALVAALQRHFEADGLAFDAPLPQRWYVRVPEGEVPETTPLHEAIGRNVYGLLPRRRGRINWLAAITEAQMVMAAHPVNAEREAAGRPAINSVWFWGGGALPARVAPAFARVHADDPFALGLARLGAAAAPGLPADLAGLAAAGPGEDVLVVDTRLSRALAAGGEAAWIAAARELESAWFASLGDALARFGTVRLVLPGPRDCVEATLAAASRWRWLRASRPLASHA